MVCREPVNQSGRALSKYQSPFGRPPNAAHGKRTKLGVLPAVEALYALMDEQAQAQVLFSDPAVGALWSAMSTGKGDDFFPGHQGISFRDPWQGVSFQDQCALISSVFSDYGIATYDKRCGTESAEFRLKFASWRRRQAKKLLDASIKNGWPALLPRIIGLGEEVNLADALALAAKINRPRCATILCGLVRADDLILEGKTALMIAVASGSAATVEALLPLSNMDIKSANGNTALDIARADGVDVNVADVNVDYWSASRSRATGIIAATLSLPRVVISGSEFLRMSRLKIRGLLDAWNDRAELRLAVACGDNAARVEPPPRARSL